jgi:DNA polymerase-3 subunit beta
MRVSTLKENLKNGLYLVGHIAGKNQNLPILNNIMLEAKEGNIKLISTNLEIGIVHNVRGKVEEEGVYTINSKVISDYVGLLPNKKINIIQKEKENELQVECENYKTKIKGQPADDFPLIPTVDKNNSFSVNVGEFKEALSKVVFAVASSESRMELTGVVFVFNGDNLTLAATDSYRLTEKNIKIKNNTNTEEEQKIIIPAKTLQELIRVLTSFKENNEVEENKSEITFYVSDNQILFTIESTEIVSKLIEGQYPDYKQIIPSKPQSTAVVNRSELIRAVKTSSLFSKSGINDINLDFPKEGGKIVVSSTSGETGENIVDIEADVKGEDNGIIVNYSYLIDGLNHINEENVQIEVIDNNTPCIIKPTQEKDYIYIIMPIKQ